MFANSLRFCGATCAIGLGCGAAHWLISQIIYLVCASPAIMGLVAGALLAESARRERVHQLHAILASAIGVAGLLYLTAEAIQATVTQLAIFAAPLPWRAYLALAAATDHRTRVWGHA